jgi:hypothetical protein
MVKIFKLIGVLTVCSLLAVPVFMMVGPLIALSMFSSALREITSGDMPSQGKPADPQTTAQAAGVATALKNASAAMASRAEARAIALHVAVIEQTTATGQWGTGGPKSIDIDVSKVGEAAVLLIADDPILWTFTSKATVGPARVALETRTYFDIRNAPPRIIAGFSGRLFGEESATGGLDMSSPDGESRSRFCTAVRSWSQSFGVDTARVKIVTYRDPGRLFVREAGVMSDNGQVSAQIALGNVCPYPVARRR